MLQAKLRLAAYEALMEMIKNSPRDCYATVQKTMLIILERLNQVLAIDGQTMNTADRVEMLDVQGLLCATLQVCKLEDLPVVEMLRFDINISLFVYRVF